MGRLRLYADASSDTALHESGFSWLATFVLPVWLLQRGLRRAAALAFVLALVPGSMALLLGLSETVSAVLAGGYLLSCGVLAAPLHAWWMVRHGWVVTAEATTAGRDLAHRADLAATDLVTTDLVKAARPRERRLLRATAAAWLGFGLLGLWVAAVDRDATWPMHLQFAAAAALLALGPVMTNLPIRWSRQAPRVGAAAGLAGLWLINEVDNPGPASSTAADPLWQSLLILAGVALA